MTAYADIDLGAISRNVARLIQFTNTPLCAVVKADAYGHGAGEVVRAAVDGGASWLAVATTPEAIDVAAIVPGIPVLVLAERPTHEIAALAGQLPADVRLTVGTTAGVAAAAAIGSPVRVHLKIDTGMHRMGSLPADAVLVAQAIAASPSLRLEALWTHMARADEPASGATERQLSVFADVRQSLAANNINAPMHHAANSAAALLRSDARLDLIRAGIAMYGVNPSASLRHGVGLEPALRLHTTVSALRVVDEGEAVSYGGRWTAVRLSRIATVPMGYADGVRRSSGIHGVEVLIKGRRWPIVGQVTMDQALVEVDDSVAVGDEVVLIGKQGDDEILVNEIADRLGTIGYEVLCGIGSRVQRRYGGRVKSAPDRPCS